MRDDAQTPDIRMHAAKLAAPYIHPRPQLEPRLVAFDLPEQISAGTEWLLAVHEALLRHGQAKATLHNQAIVRARGLGSLARLRPLTSHNRPQGYE